MLYRTPTLLALLAGLCLAGCDLEEPAGAVPDPLLTLHKGANSGVSSARIQVIYTASEFAALWAEHEPGAALPAVDFGGRMVIAAFFGGTPAVGYDIEVLRARTLGGVLEVVIRHTQPGLGCFTPALPQTPFHIVVLPRQDEPVFLDTHTVIYEC